MAPRLAPITRNQLMDLEQLLQRSRPLPVESPLMRNSSRHLPVTNTHPRNSIGSLARDAMAVHAFGSFQDVLKSPPYASWSSADRALYLLWWSFRPSHCRDCGSAECWTPSPEDEYRCGHCCAGAGTTALRDNVEEMGMHDDDEDDSDGEPAMNASEGAGGDGRFGDMTALALYQYYLAWLQSVPTILHDTLPLGEDLPKVLRVSYELATVLGLPTSSQQSARLTRASALFLGLASQSFSIPFPLFVLGGHHAELDLGVSSSHRSLANKLPAGSASLFSLSRSEDLLWLDVEAAAAQIGLPLPHFFESQQATTQFMQNAMALVVAEFRVPSVLWRLDRVAGRSEFVATLAHKAQGHLSPEHRAVVVALELCRLYDSQCRPLLPTSACYDTRVAEWYRQYHEDPRLAYRALFDVLGEDAKVRQQQQDPTGTSSTTPQPTVIHCFIPGSHLCDLLLRMIAYCYRMSPLVLCDLLEESKCFDGSTNFHLILQRCAERGAFGVVPLYRRTTPLHSPWTVVHRALHSEDRLPLLTALGHIASAVVREREIPAAKLVQRICRKHGSSTGYRFYYALRCVDPDEKHMHGLYVCTFVCPRFAVFTCIRSGRKTITYHTPTQTISICYLGSKERVLQDGSLEVVWVPPLTAAVEGGAAKYVMDCSRSGLHLGEWNAALQKLQVSSLLRMGARTTPFPTWALGQIRELLQEASSSHDLQDAQLSSAASAFTSASALERVAQRELLSVQHPSMLLALTDDQALMWYHVLYTLVEGRCDVTRQAAAAVGVDDAMVSDTVYESRLFGRPAKRRHRIEDAEECAADVVRCVKAIRSGVRADVSEEQRKRSNRRKRREEELQRCPNWTAE